MRRVPGLTLTFIRGLKSDALRTIAYAASAIGSDNAPPSYQKKQAKELVRDLANLDRGLHELDCDLDTYLVFERMNRNDYT